MGTTTLSALRQELLEEIGDYRAETTTSAGTTTTLLATPLANKPDDYYNDWWVLLTSGNNNGVARQASDFVSAAGSITVYTAWTAVVANSTGFIVTRFDPAVLTRCINDAAREAYPWLSRPIIDENLITHNWLLDGGMEDWSSSTALRNWTSVGSPTLARSTSGVQWGTYYAGVTPAATTEGITQGGVQHPALFDLLNREITFKAMVYGTSGDVKLRIRDSSGTTLSAANSTGVRWELLTATRTIAATATSVNFDIVSTGNEVFRADQARVTGPPRYHYRLAAHIVDVQKVELQTAGLSDYACDDRRQNYPFTMLHDWKVIDDGTNRNLHIRQAIPEQYKLRLTATGYLSTLSSDTDTIEIDDERIRVLVAFAAYKLFESYSSLVAGGDRERYEREAEKWYQKYLSRRATMCRLKSVTIPF